MDRKTRSGAQKHHNAIYASIRELKGGNKYNLGVSSQQNNQNAVSQPISMIGFYRVGDSSFSEDATSVTITFWHHNASLDPYHFFIIIST